MKATRMEISERELLAMARELDQMHRESLPRFHETVAALGEAARDKLARAQAANRLSTTRRNFLRGGVVTAGALGGGLLVSGCNGGGSTTSPSSSARSDLAQVRTNASIEVLAVTTYDLALRAAASGALGPIPPAISTFATTVRSQHQQHGDAFNAILTQGGERPQTEPDPALMASVRKRLQAVKTVADVARLALDLEQAAYETYTRNASTLTDRNALSVSLSIAPVEAQHAAVLFFVLGSYPVPDARVKTDKARTPEDLAVTSSSGVSSG
ncbi:MAG: ferritin-like domain-containing protein [Chloroflexi bacterium]|nr:MAG: ferritin-like domain-containing protein [Chloroflexota bacterium]